MTKDGTLPDKEMIFLRPAAGYISDLLWHTRRELRQLQERQQLLNKLEKSIARDLPLHLLSVLDEINRFLEQGSSDGVSEMGAEPEPPQDWFLQESLRKVTEIAQEAKKHLFLSYPNELERACKRVGLCLDKSGRHPVYSFDKGFFELRVKQKTGKAVLSNSERKCSEFLADIGTVIEQVQKHHKRVFDRGFNGEDFLKRLRNEYLNVLQQDRLMDGAPVSLRRTAQNMMTHAKGGGSKGRQPDEFVVDLSRLINTGLVEIEGRRLELLQTDDSKQGILLHDVPISWYVGSVRFKEVRP